MKTKVLFTAALMAAAASGAQAASYTESNMLLQLLESQRYEGVSLLADEVEEGLTDIAGLVLRNAKMPTISSAFYDTDKGWLTDATGGNFRNCFEIPQKNLSCLMYSFSCVPWAKTHPKSSHDKIKNSF